MKNKIYKIVLLLAISLAMPGISNTFSFGNLIPTQVMAAENDGTGTDKGGTSTKDGGSTKGGGSGGTVIGTIIDALGSIFSGIGGGTNPTSA